MVKFQAPKSWHLLVTDLQQNTYALFGPYTEFSKTEDKVIDAVNLANENGRQLQQQIVVQHQLKSDLPSFVKNLREVPRQEILEIDLFED